MWQKDLSEAALILIQYRPFCARLSLEPLAQTDHLNYIVKKLHLYEVWTMQFVITIS